MSARITLRLPAQIGAWLAELGGEQSATLRALAVLGAHQLGLPGAEREAWRLLAQEPGAAAAAALAELVCAPDSRQTRARLAPDVQQPGGSQTAASEMTGGADDLLGVGIDV